MSSGRGGITQYALILMMVAIVGCVGLAMLSPAMTETGEEFNKAVEQANQHAVQKHSIDAQAALNHVAWNSAFCKWECPDGRTRWACSMGGGKWAIVVKEGNVLITAFTSTSQDYVKGITAGCKNRYRPMHP